MKKVLPVSPEALPPPDMSPTATAFFLDVDGTLAEIVADPAQARVKAEVLNILEVLMKAAGGAVALISGRSITQLDTMLHPLRLPSVGVHGLERRIAGDEVKRSAIDRSAHAHVVAETRRFALKMPGLLPEVKPGSVALHYRACPENASACIRFMRTQALNDPRFSTIEGKMVVELKFGQQTKGDAIGDLMMCAPFRGRTAFFAGDDITDEAGFARINDLGGVSVKIGSEPSDARFRLPNPEALAAYLAEIVHFQLASEEHSKP